LEIIKTDYEKFELLQRLENEEKAQQKVLDQ
jgi:uncharacterized FlaG/YvyC family protein